MTRNQAEAMAVAFWNRCGWDLDTVAPRWKDLADYLEGKSVLTQEEIDRMEKTS